MKNEETNGVDTEKANHVVGIHNVAARLAHFAVALDKPWMTKNLLRKWDVQSHKHNWPINGVETKNVLANKVQVGWPVRLVVFAVVAICIVAKASEIVCKGVNPNVNNVLVVEVYWDAPLKGCSGHAKVLKSWFNEVVDHLVFAGFRLNEFRILLDVLHESILIFFKFEEVCFLLSLLNVSAAVWTFAIYQLRLCEE